MNQIGETLFLIYLIDGDEKVQTLYDDVTGLSVKLFWGRAGMAIVTVPEGHDFLNYTDLDQLVFIVMSVPTTAEPSDSWGTTWTVSFRGLVRDSQVSTDDFGNISHLIYISHLTQVLDRYISAYPTGLAGKSEWSSTEMAIIANDLVRWNATADGTIANGRIRDTTVIGEMQDMGAISGTDPINFAMEPGRNLLDVLIEIGATAGFVPEVGTEYDYMEDLTMIGRFAARQRVSTDRSADIIFSLSLDNMSAVSISSDGLREKTVAIVGGPGTGADRAFVVRTGENYAVTNDSEVWVDGSSKASDELDDLGDIQLEGLKARVNMDAEVFSSKAFIYNRDFFLGDLVAVYLGTIVAVKRIDSVEIVWDQGGSPSQNFELVE